MFRTVVVYSVGVSPNQVHYSEQIENLEHNCRNNTISKSANTARHAHSKASVTTLPCTKQHSSRCCTLKCRYESKRFRFMGLCNCRVLDVWTVLLLLRQRKSRYMCVENIPSDYSTYWPSSLLTKNDILNLILYAVFSSYVWWSLFMVWKWKIYIKNL